MTLIGIFLSRRCRTKILNLLITFTAHLSVTIKRFTRYNQKVVLAAMLEGKSIPSNMAANTNHTTLLKNQSYELTHFKEMVRV